ncbi:MAG TPA: hypothetical protein VIS51_05935 [Solirubrobacterales bacterium]
MGEAPAATAQRDLAGEYLDELQARFEQAADGRLLAQELEIGGLRLSLRFAGEAMREALLAPFAHLVTSGGAPAALSISVFDGASTGVEAPLPAWDPVDAAPGTNPVARLRSARAGVLAAAGTGAVTAAEPGRGQAAFYLPDAARISPIERAAPLRDALQLLMTPHGRWLTHAGAVGRKGRGVLLVGRGGSGKSTLALSCALAGMEIVADDYVLLENDPPLAHAMQSTAKLTEDSSGRLGLGAEAIDPAGFEPTLEGSAKALVDIRTLAPGSMRRDLQIVAIVAPALHGETEATLRPISAAEGLRAVAPSTIVQSGFHGAAALAALGELVRAVPSYALGLSPDPAENAAAVDRLVGELG